MQKMKGFKKERNQKESGECTKYITCTLIQNATKMRKKKFQPKKKKKKNTHCDESNTNKRRKKQKEENVRRKSQ
jgi:hypothetical protein